MTLGQRQEQFAAMVPRLINKAIEMGYGVRIGDCFRDPRVHGAVGEKKGYGHAKSCHKLKLAIDLNLCIAGELITDSRGHSSLHDYWDSLGGADRIENDMNHYSLYWEGMR